MVGARRRGRGRAAAPSPRRAAQLDAWRARADFLDPYAFFARDPRPPTAAGAQFLRRLGAEAEDVLDEFLAQALAYEKAHTPSLQGFLAWLDAAETEIRRDTDTIRDEVRVMTVHGAKGLEADIVFLVDNGSQPVHPTTTPRSSRSTTTATATAIAAGLDAELARPCRRGSRRGSTRSAPTPRRSTAACSMSR